ncbi:hypothetical protein sphantq_01683 [Sphingobium sp. AntQ-1]|nr:hypothetical protein sphantq_01683 [Sphingobium sp. AntQ-1]
MHYSTGKPDRSLPCRGIVRQFSAFLVKVAPAINGMKKSNEASPSPFGNRFQMKGRPPVTATVAPVV